MNIPVKILKGEEAFDWDLWNTTPVLKEIPGDVVDGIIPKGEVI